MVATLLGGNEPECPVLLVATPGPEGVDPLGSELGHRRGASQLELPLLPEQITIIKYSILRDVAQTPIFSSTNFT